MIWHKAIGADPDISHSYRFLKQINKLLIIFGICKYSITSPAAVQDMIIGVSIFDSKGSGYI